MARKAALLTLGTQVAIQGIGLVTGILVARLLGPEGRGELAAIVVWVSMVSYLGNLGIPEAYTYAAARQPQRTRQLLGNGAVAVLVQWPLLVLIGLLVLKLALSDYSQATRNLAVLYLGLYVPLNLLTLYLNAIQRGHGRYGRFNAVRACVPASYLLALGVLIAADQMTLGGVVAANLFSNLSTLVLVLILMLPAFESKREGRHIFDFRALRQDIRYGLSAHLGAIQPFNGLRIDVLLLTVLLTPHSLGLYMAAAAGAALIRAQGRALGMVTMPEVAKHTEIAAQRRVIARFAGFALALGGCSAAVVFVWADPLVKLVYGSAFSGAVTALRLLVIGAVVASIQRVLADGLRGMGRPLSGTAAELASLIVGVPAIVGFVQVYGMNGGAAAVGLASAGALVVALWALLRAPSSVTSQVDRRIRPGTDTVPGRIG